MEQKALDSIIIFTDGACTGNPGPGGWASIIAYPEGQVRELGGHDPATTNNRMEILGTLKALQLLGNRPENVVVYTDSVYVIKGITEWIWAWRKRGWKTAEGNEVSNQDLWQALSAVVAQRKEFGLQWKFVKGHSGVPGNERCDEIAVAFSKKRRMALYDGPLLQYTHAIYDLPPDRDLPEPRPKEVKKPAHSYMSVIGGIVTRHKSWKGCELTVKGKSGAKFKKAMSEDDENAILKGWGLEPSKVKIEDDPR